EVSPIGPLQSFRTSPRRENVCSGMVVAFRARLFLFPVDCSLFPLYYPLLFHQQLDKSEFTHARTAAKEEGTAPINKRNPQGFPQPFLIPHSSFLIPHLKTLVHLTFSL
ncbi:MAG: hypothetical protein IJH03_05190, partial [Clostridia bacterium]|nr:hypothetical protein [Clostridia bacterium]